MSQIKDSGKPNGLNPYKFEIDLSQYSPIPSTFLGITLQNLNLKLFTYQRVIFHILFCHYL